MGVREKQDIEFKANWRDEYLKWICGFANANGGRIFIGVNDDGSACDINDAKRLLEDIPNKVRDSLGMTVDFGRFFISIPQLHQSLHQRQGLLLK